MTSLLTKWNALPAGLRKFIVGVAVTAALAGLSYLDKNLSTLGLSAAVVTLIRTVTDAAEAALQSSQSTAVPPPTTN